MNEHATHSQTTIAIRNLAAGKIRFALNHALKTFDATPDDKLDYKPSASSNSPRELICHMLVGNAMVGQVLGIEGSPAEGPTDREALVSRLKTSTEAIIAKIEDVSDAAMDTMVLFGGRPMPMPAFLLINEWHISRHAGQIDYIQTIWGDLENHF